MIFSIQDKKKPKKYSIFRIFFFFMFQTSEVVQKKIRKDGKKEKLMTIWLE